MGARNSGGLILIHNIISMKGQYFLFKSQKVKTFGYPANLLCEILNEPDMILSTIPISVINKRL